MRGLLLCLLALGTCLAGAIPAPGPDSKLKEVARRTSHSLVRRGPPSMGSGPKKDDFISWRQMWATLEARRTNDQYMEGIERDIVKLETYLPRRHPKYACMSTCARKRIRQSMIDYFETHYRMTIEDAYVECANEECDFHGPDRIQFKPVTREQKRQQELEERRRSATENGDFDNPAGNYFALAKENAKGMAQAVQANAKAALPKDWNAFLVAGATNGMKSVGRLRAVPV